MEGNICAAPQCSSSSSNTVAPVGELSVQQAEVRTENEGLMLASRPAAVVAKRYGAAKEIR